MTKRHPICPSHGAPINQRIHWVNGRIARLCPCCVADAGWTWRRVNPEFDRIFIAALDEIFGKKPPRKKSEPMSDRELDGLLDRVAARGYAPG